MSHVQNKLLSREACEDDKMDDGWSSGWSDSLWDQPFDGKHFKTNDTSSSPEKLDVPLISLRGNISDGEPDVLSPVAKFQMKVEALSRTVKQQLSSDGHQRETLTANTASSRAALQDGAAMTQNASLDPGSPNSRYHQDFFLNPDPRHNHKLWFCSHFANVDVHECMTFRS